MASPSPSASSAGSGSLYGRPPTLEQLVGHFVAAKRSLGSTSYVWRANEIVNAARVLLEDNAVLSSKNVFLRRTIEEQVDALEALRRGVDLVGIEGQMDFKSLLGTLDTSSNRLQTTLTVLKQTPIEPSLQPGGPQKYLYDFIDSQAVTSLHACLRSCIDRVNTAAASLADSADVFDGSLRTLQKALSSIPPSPEQDSLSPLPSYFRDLEGHATETATCLQSLVRHYDMCVTALKHTEGGGEAASRATNEIGEAVAGVELETLDENVPPQPLTESERADMLTVLDKDAAEVDDVTSEIRERAAEMEMLLEAMSTHLSELRNEHTALIKAMYALHSLGKETKGFIGAAAEFTRGWHEEKAQIEGGMDELEGLREFFEGFEEAYYGLLVEVARRRGVQEGVRQIARDAAEEIARIYEEEFAAREAFTTSQGTFLPSDIWPGLTDPPVRYRVTTVGDEQGSIPDIQRDVLERALQRTKDRI